MQNPTYAGEFHKKPHPEHISAMQFRRNTDTAPFREDFPEQPMLSVGIKTITHNRDGLKLYPTDVVVVEISCGKELGSMDLSPKLARDVAGKLLEFADTIEGPVLQPGTL